MAATIQFLNHASVLLAAGDASLVSDPWYSGAAFNHGWDLIATDPSLAEIAEHARNIWVSHEHPDHFSVQFFRSHQPRAEVLFQRTRDRRVVTFLEKEGWSVRECPVGTLVDIGDATLTIGRKDFYDSWSLFEGGGTRILNLNDCAFRTADTLKHLRAATGAIDVLLTQFSYAGWKGGRSQRRLREAAARERLDILAMQAEILEARWVVPFASFAYFSHEDNQYLNDATNHVDAVAAVLPDGCDAIVMKPRDQWTVGEPWDNRPAIAFWRERIAMLATAPRHKTGAAVTLRTLQSQADKWRTRLARRNWKAWMWLARLVPFVDALRPVRVYLTDIGHAVEVSPFSPLKVLRQQSSFHVQMASECLSFIFLNEFGYDTLIVNGRFEASRRGFRRMTRTFALGSLNAAGLSLGPSLLLRSDVIRLLMRGLRGRPPEVKQW